MGRPVILDQSHIISLEGQKLEMMLVPWEILMP